MKDALDRGWTAASRQVSFIDRSRPIKASSGFGGAAERRIDATLWHPSADTDSNDRPAPAANGPWPLVVYCHGTAGSPDNATYLATELVHHGYIVVAPDFPLTSVTAFTRVTAPDISDAGEQVRDVRFLIDRLLADPLWGPLIDETRIASMGHSLGGITCWFLSFGAETRDPRIVATVLLGAGDPAVAAQATDIGLSGAGHVPATVPALLVSAEKDLFTRMMGPPGTAYAKLDRPKFEVTIAGGAHTWFKDGDIWPADNKNPDCLFFEEHSPGFHVPGSEERVPLIGPARQQEITLAAVQAFLDAFLKDDASALANLNATPQRFAEATLACSA